MIGPLDWAGARRGRSRVTGFVREVAHVAGGGPRGAAALNAGGRGQRRHSRISSRCAEHKRRQCLSSVRARANSVSVNFPCTASQSATTSLRPRVRSRLHAASASHTDTLCSLAAAASRTAAASLDSREMVRRSTATVRIVRFRDCRRSQTSRLRATSLASRQAKPPPTRSSGDRPQLGSAPRLRSPEGASGTAPRLCPHPSRLQPALLRLLTRRAALNKENKNNKGNKYTKGRKSSPLTRATHMQRGNSAQAQPPCLQRSL